MTKEYAALLFVIRAWSLLRYWSRDGRPFDSSAANHLMRGGFSPLTKHNIIVIGTSAGDVEALCELNKNLPENLDASVFVVMHVGTQSLLPEVLSRHHGRERSQTVARNSGADLANEPWKASLAGQPKLADIHSQIQAREIVS